MNNVLFLLEVFVLLPFLIWGKGKAQSYTLKLAPADESSIFENTNYYVWGASPIRAADGTYHIYYAQWPRKEGFDSWTTYGEVLHAVAPKLDGPYVFHDVALGARGNQFWDGESVYNPTVHFFNGKYYLYYTGTTGKNRKSYWEHRNNQRIGVAVSDSPNGPWKRFDKPMIDVSPERDAPDSLMTANPAITQMPDGKYLMVFKGVGKKNPLPFGGPVVHLVAIGDDPADGSTFKKLMKPIFVPKKGNYFFPAEDSYVWCEDGHFYAVVKDVHGTFTPTKIPALVIFHSADGKEWTPTDKPFFTTTRIAMKDGTEMRLTNLERPQLFLENGKPVMFFFAGRVPRRHGIPNSTFNIHIRLNEK